MASNKLEVVLSAFPIFVSFLFFLDGPTDAKLDDVLVLVLEVNGVLGLAGVVEVIIVALDVFFMGFCSPRSRCCSGKAIPLEWRLLL